MLSHIRVIVVLVCVGIVIAPQFVWAYSPHSGKGRDFFSFFRSYQSPVVKNDVSASNGASSASNHRMARMYVEQNDIAKANTHFGLALKNAAPNQVPAIAFDYASFLLDTGDLHRAELILRQALTQSPDNADIIRMLAQCLVKQDKMVEGLRYFKSIYSEAEARQEIAAIYRKQGNTDMLAAVERKWGAANSAPVRSAPLRPEPVLIASAPEPTMPKPAASLPLPPQASPRAVTSPPSTMVAHAVRTLPPAPSVVVPKNTAPREIMPQEVMPKDVPLVAAAPTALPSKSEFFDMKVPIPVPQGASQPIAVAKNTPRMVSTPIPVLPVPIPAVQQAEKLVLENPVKLAVAPRPSQVFAEEKELPRPAVAIQPRRHYVVNAGTVANLDLLFPIKSVAATMLAE